MPPFRQRLRARSRRVAIVRHRDVYEPQIQRVAEALAESGFDVEVLCLRNRRRSRTTVVNGVKITGLPGSLERSGTLRYIFDYSSFFVLVALTLAGRHIRRPYAAVQVYTMPDFLVFAAAVPRLFGARVVAYMNEPTPELFETLFGGARLRRLLEWIEQRVLRFADHSITVTDDLKERFVERGADADRITVVLNAADPGSPGEDRPSMPSGEGKSEFVVLCHGAVEERYGHDDILEAAQILRADIPELRVVFTGRGSYEDALVERLEALGLGDAVRFEGWVSRERLDDLLTTADAGVVAQKASPYSHLVHTYKMFDYWIFGLPVVASRLRAVSRSYDDSVIEYFAPDDPADLARAIRRLHADPERRESLAKNGRAVESRLGWHVQKRTFLGVYDRLFPERRLSASLRSRASQVRSPNQPGSASA